MGDFRLPQKFGETHMDPSEEEGVVALSFVALALEERTTAAIAMGAATVVPSPIVVTGRRQSS